MNRKNWVDIAKAFSIIAVVIGHLNGIPALLNQFIFSFHVPLFFIMSGYFIKDSTDIKKSVKKDAKGLLLPYAVACLIIILIAGVLAFLRDESIFEAVKKWTLASLYGSGGPTIQGLGIGWIGALWFLLALFFAKLIIYLTECLGKYQWVGLLIIGYIGYATKDFIWLPLSLQAGMCASCFVYLGKVCGKHNLFEKTYNSGKVSLFIFLPILWIFGAYYGGKLWMVSNHYGNGFLDVIVSVAATFTVAWISIFIEKHIPFIASKLAGIGRITLAVLAAHIIELNLFPWGFLFEKLGIPMNWGILLAFKAVLITVLCVCFYFIPVINNIFFPTRKKLKAQK